MIYFRLRTTYYHGTTFTLTVHVLRQLFVILLLCVKLKVHNIALVQCNLLVVANVDLFGALTVCG